MNSFSAPPVKAIAFIFIYFIMLHCGPVALAKDKKNDLVPHFKTNKVTPFEIFTPEERAMILYNENGSSLDSISAYLLAADIYKVTGYRPIVSSTVQDKNQNVIVIGELHSDFISKFLRPSSLHDSFINQKERYLHRVITSQNNAKKVLVIAGTDPRGTAYGVFELSKRIGVSPWYWWADAPIAKKDQLVIAIADFYSKSPSVAYRGIFLNDEDWGLQPWAAKTFEPAVGDIGPKTYGKIFELLLRLKANTIWPAMHPSTKAFFHYPENPKMAKRYHIIVGTSHAEPMLRNNVDEWDHNTMGSFNYLSNKDRVVKYWEKRVEQAKNLEAIYTLGMRGIHDSGMEGVDGIEEATANLQNVLHDQRAMLERYHDQSLEEIPQVFTVYKEVLALYDQGLEVPEDVTIMWTDDNYGYIRRLSNEQERQRKGGSGVYYHTSYWGRPHDYLWLNTTPPTLMWSQMKKAFETGSKKIWILNVGDIKPAEYNIDLFLEMAYDMEAFQTSEAVENHMVTFYNSIFGNLGKAIAKLKSQYYHLAFERKPAFMGWSQTEPTTEIDTTAYTPFAFGDELNKRINSYQALETTAQLLEDKIAPDAKDAFFQLVYYPVKGASFMNKKFLYRDLAIKYASKRPIAADCYKKRSASAYDSIVALTMKYNTGISKGKWNHFMNMAPRNLPVFHKPEISIPKSTQDDKLAGVFIEQSAESPLHTLPTFNENLPQKHFIDLFLKADQTTHWHITAKPEFVMVSHRTGTLTSANSTDRILVSIDWKKWRKYSGEDHATFTINMAGASYPVHLKLRSLNLPQETNNLFISNNGIVVIYAHHYSSKTSKGNHLWKTISGLGHSGSLMQASPFTQMPLDTLTLENNSPVLTYDIFIEKPPTKPAQLVLNALPTHPLTNHHSVRVGVQWNNNPIKIVDLRTFGRSEQWKQNVLKNIATTTIPISITTKGKNTLKLYMIDQGVAVDYMYINLTNEKLPYSVLPETRL